LRALQGPVLEEKALGSAQPNVVFSQHITKNDDTVPVIDLPAKTLKEWA
jgi:hypothetical protein